MALKSAYQVLGVPANASAADIERAFETARAFYTRERIAADADARDRWNDAQAAWQILRNPETRAALDKRIAATGQPPQRPRQVVAPDDLPSPALRLMRTAFVLVLALFVAGGLWSWRNSVHRAEVAAAEKAAQEQREREEREQQARLAREEAERRAAAERAESADRRAAANAHRAAAIASAQAQAIDSSLAWQRQREATQREAMQAAEDRRQEYEARRRADEDRQRIRNLCMQNYGRPVC
jgi:curved DNA-binding protein CbpA